MAPVMNPDESGDISITLRFNYIVKKLEEVAELLREANRKLDRILDKIEGKSMGRTMG